MKAMLEAVGMKIEAVEASATKMKSWIEELQEEYPELLNDIETEDDEEEPAAIHCSENCDTFYPDFTQNEIATTEDSDDDGYCRYMF